MATAADRPQAVLLRGEDNVAVAARPIARGSVVELPGLTVEVREPIELGHKLAHAADRPRCAGAEVRPDHRFRRAGH